MAGYVYIITNSANTVLYTGVTSNLVKRIGQHRAGLGGQFAGRYRCKKLVYYEIFESIHNAIEREKQIKGGSRKKKVALVGASNPEWVDLFETLI